jgi:antitoxin component of MazEF toxin-antitoxin module
MKLPLVRIGNSRGLCIAKALIEECGFGKTVEGVVENNRLVIAAERVPRQGWKNAFGAPTPPLMARLRSNRISQMI